MKSTLKLKIKTEDNSKYFRPTTSASSFVKLPSINIKSFHGIKENWHTFIDSFECALDKNDTSSDIQKMNYLKNLIEDKAAPIISCIKLAKTAFTLIYILMVYILIYILRSDTFFDCVITFHLNQIEFDTKI